MSTNPQTLTNAPRIRWHRNCGGPGPSLVPTDLRGWLGGNWRNGATVTVCGAGAVGGAAALQAARLGFRVLCMDPDRFGEESWRTQWCQAADAGRPKAEVLCERLQKITKETNVLCGEGFVQDAPWQMLYHSDAIVAAGDNLELLAWLSQIGAAFGKPIVQGAVHGETWSSIVRVWPMQSGRTACPACAIGAGEWSQLRVRRGCDVRSLYAVGETSTRTLPFLCATAGQQVCAELVQLAANGPADESSFEVLYSMLTHRVLRSVYERHPDCRCPHERWEVQCLTAGPEEVALGDVLKLGLESTGEDSRGVEVSSELPWCSWTLCGGCGRGRSIQRFAHAGDAVGWCECGAILEARSQGLRRVIPESDVTQRAGALLSEVGLPPGRAIVIQANESAPWCGFVGPLGDVPHDPGGLAEASSAGNGDLAQGYALHTHPESVCGDS